MDFPAILRRHPAQRVALVHQGRSLTWGEVCGRVEQVAGAVGDIVEVGDVVAVVGDTSIEFVEVLLGALSSGAAVLPLHTRYPLGELDHACRLASPRVIVSVGASETVEAVCDALKADGHRPNVVDAVELSGADPLESCGFVAPKVDEHAPALMLFTSGTAGSPRIAMLSRSNLRASIESTLTSAAGVVTPNDILMGVMPLTHVLGVVSVLGVSVAVGATLVLPDDARVESVVAAVRQHQVSVLVAPPVFWFRLAEAAEPTAVGGLDRAAVSSIKLALSGAAPLSADLADRIESFFDLELRQGYGLTEASPGLTSSVGTDAPATSVGRPVPGVELRLVDEAGADVYIGDVGEVWARGDNVFLGYLNDPEATAAAVDSDGWLHTGDLGVVDEQGYLYIVGRSKDQIITGGFNVHPGEVEDWLAKHPAVSTAAVIGEPDPEYGEVVTAFVVPASRAVAETPPSERELQGHCRKRLAGYKVPRRIEFVDELPRGDIGKVRRRMLRDTQ